MLDDWRLWQHGRFVDVTLVRPLAEGSRHRAVEVIARSAEGSEQLVVRTPKPLAGPRLGLSFEQEVTLHAHAARHGVAPKLYHASPRRQLTVTAAAKVASDLSTQNVATLIKRIHSLPPEAMPCINLRRMYQQYTHQTGTPAANTPLIAPLDQALKQLSQGPQCICHNDLSRDNIVAGAQGLQAIDWEYGGLNSPYFDLAAARAVMPELDWQSLAREVIHPFSEPLWQAAAIVFDAIGAAWQQRLQQQQSQQ